MSSTTDRTNERTADANLSEVPAVAQLARREPTPPGGPGGILDLSLTVPIGDVAPRARAQVSGTVGEVRVRTTAGAPILDVEVVDGTGSVVVSFFGRRSLGGVQPGSTLTVEGMVLRRGDGFAMLNPAYDLRPAG